MGGFKERNGDMVIVVRASARKQLNEIFNYYCAVATKNVALKIIGKIREAIDILAMHPKIGPILYDYTDDVPFTYRSLVAHPNYKVIYRIDKDRVIVVAVWDCRQDPKMLEAKLLS